jgi:protein SCO1
MHEDPVIAPPIGVRVFGNAWTWVLIMVSVAGFNIVRAVRKDIPEPLQVLGTVPEFSLTNQLGEPFGSRELEGKAWIANFIFTRCPTVCPAFTAKMAEVRHRSRGLGNAIHLVSFSVDPEHDTPETLLAYAKKSKSSPGVWSFLTGPMEAVKEVVITGLKMSMGNEDPEGNFAGIFHGSHFVLVDAKRQIRGYYDANDDDAIDRVLIDAGWLLNLQW